LARGRDGLLVLGKYVLFQLPGWLLVGTLAWAAHRWLGLDARLALGVLALLVLKDAVLFRFVRDAYAVSPRPALESLRGAHGIARQRIATSGRQHRIEDQGNARMRRGNGRDGAYVAGGSEHADLEGRDLALGQQRVRLACDEVRGNRFEVLDAACVLHREAGQYRERMAAKRRQREQVGLQSRPTSGIGRSERENDRRHELISGPIL